jgi:hypothetical protein
VTESDAPKRRRRRGGRRAKPKPNPNPETLCQREGCVRRRDEARAYCSLLCKAVAQRLENTEALCRALGPGEQSTAIWLAAVAVNDAVSGLYEAQRGAVKALKARESASIGADSAGVLG